MLCLEKNQYIGGMASTIELIHGYRFEIAGSVLFPVPDEIYDDLGLDACPTLDTEVMSVNIGEPDDAADDLLQRPRAAARATSPRTTASRRCSGMAEIAAWADAPARALGRFDVRTATQARSTRCSPAPRTRRSARRSGPRCSAA